MNRITFFTLSFSIAVAFIFMNNTATAETITVYKSPTCGCCKGWVDYLRDEGFTVETIDTDVLTEIKAEHGLTDGRLMSCHTALINGYVVEGHVPVNDIRRLIEEKPDIVGITAPGCRKCHRA